MQAFAQIYRMYAKETGQISTHTRTPSMRYMYTPVFTFTGGRSRLQTYSHALRLHPIDRLHSHCVTCNLLRHV